MCLLDVICQIPWTESVLPYAVPRCIPRAVALRRLTWTSLCSMISLPSSRSMIGARDAAHITSSYPPTPSHSIAHRVQTRRFTKPGLNEPMGNPRKPWDEAAFLFIVDWDVILKGFTKFQQRRSDRNNVRVRFSYRASSLYSQKHRNLNIHIF